MTNIENKTFMYKLICFLSGLFYLPEARHNLTCRRRCQAEGDPRYTGGWGGDPGAYRPTIN